MTGDTGIHETTDHSTSPAFSDIIHGEDLEFRHEHEKPFPVRHKFQVLGKFTPPSILSRCSNTQLVTIAGAASGFLAGVVVCPLDVIKTRLQAQQDKANRLGFRQMLTRILRTEGITGLYRGLVPITIGYLPTWTIYFTVYERAKKFYPHFIQRHWDIDSPTLNHFCSAITAGMTSSIAVNPIWVVKTRLMIQSNTRTSPTDVVYKGTIDAFRTMYQEEGIRVFYSGLIPSLFGLIHVGIHFPVYEKMKSWLHCSTIDQQNEVPGLLWRLIAASSISKMIASTITYPHEILRTRLQMRKNGQKQVAKANAKGSLLKTISHIYHKEGLRGFYAGYVTNLIRTVPASAVTLVSFEYFKTYLLEIGGKTGKMAHL
ncbi:hypothetical protein KGF57_005345 [Candida theae]|uniref:Mitochondrial thiamine pyrophosphate carrier 1 n=1 Tax=Candida theae TaxID=1198502 RepID=A0AAD5B9Y2_9ASCO|nr:uncharacterized protein KGF57_005345 [Candida theae]KAI5948734.1 hypothetical protein KGF57_005345 [Candida theae]